MTAAAPDDVPLFYNKQVHRSVQEYTALGSRTYPPPPTGTHCTSRRLVIQMDDSGSRPSVGLIRAWHEGSCWNTLDLDRECVFLEVMESAVCASCYKAQRSGPGECVKGSAWVVTAADKSCSFTRPGAAISINATRFFFYFHEGVCIGK